jgi:hypothetical protein
MDKIEKLELPYDDGKGNFSSGAGEIQIIRKVNEIIDVLNSQLFEPKILNYPTDQSQKQPEGLEEETEAEKHEREFLGKLKYGAELIDEYEEREQPEKQPEGEITAGDVFQLRRLEAFAEDYKKLKESLDKPEKQEECIKDR